MDSSTENQVKSGKPSLFGMIWSPSEQFDKLRGNPKIWGPLAVVTLLYVVGMGIMAFTMDPTEILKEQGLSEAEMKMAETVGKVTTALMGLIVPALGILLSSVLQFIVTKFTSSTVRFKQLFSMNTFIMVIGALGLIFNQGLIAAIGGNPDVYITSLAGLLNAEPGILGNFEVFEIWTVVLTALGLNRVAGLSKGVAWTIAIAFFMMGIGFALLGSLFQGVAGV